MSAPVKVKHYYVLRVVSVVYKLLAILTVIITTSAVAWVMIDISYGNHPDRYSPPIAAMWILQVSGMIVGGGLLALTFAVIGQLIDLLITMNDNMRVISQNDEEVAQNIKAIADYIRSNRQPTRPRDILSNAADTKSSLP